MNFEDTITLIETEDILDESYKIIGENITFVGGSFKVRDLR